MKRLVAAVFIDALGYRIAQRFEFLKNDFPYRVPLKTVFGFSSAADPSILTGRYPDEHTHWSSFYYSPETSPFKVYKALSVLPGAIFDRWKFRHAMSKVVAKLHGFTGYFETYSLPFGILPYFDYLEKRDYFVPGGILRTDTIIDGLTARGIPFHVSNWRLSETENLAIARRKIEEGRIRFLYLYLPKLDAVEHQYGVTHAKVAEKLASLSADITGLLDRAKECYDEVRPLVFSDHGMTDVHKTAEVMAPIEALGLRFGRDYAAIYDSTMARFWFLREGAEARIREALAAIPEGDIVAESELKAMHVHFPDGKFGHLFFLMKPGVLLCPSHMGLRPLAAMHGYHPGDPDSDSILLSKSPIPADVSSITDLRRMMEKDITDGR